MRKIVSLPDAGHGDFADQALANLEAHISIEVAKATKWHELSDAQPAVEGEHRMCANPECGKEISEARLKAVPKTRLCLKCKQASEEN